MTLVCTAIVDDDRVRENLKQCIGILGGKPQVSGNSVCVEYNGSVENADKFIELFEQFTTHSISTL